MKLDRPLFIFDIESTGADPATDRIVQFALNRIEIDGTFSEKSRLVNPTIPIKAATTAVHGITDSQVENEPTFRSIAKSIHGLMQGCDLGGYNILSFDIPLLFEEFFRAGIEWDTTAHRVVDGFAVWRAMQPRKLVNAMREFTTMEVADDDLHDASIDTAVTTGVIFGQLNRWPDVLHSVEEIHKLTRPMIEIDGEEMERVDLAGVLARRGDGVVVFTHKKVRGIPVIDDRGYANWLLRNDFSQNTKMHLMAALGIPRSAVEAA